MRRWEKRLGDAAHALINCRKTYFEPDLFRQNVNHFLTTIRTVTFLIAKDKAIIPDYERWLSSAIGKYWSGDEVMLWAKESRNYIEKEGDLDLQSSLSVSLIFSYFSSEDRVIEIDRSDLLSAGIEKLMRLAEIKLPYGVRAAAAVKIERRWVANKLPNRELLQSMIYVYNRYRQACADLSEHLGSTLSVVIPTAESIGESHVFERRVSYVKFNDKASYSMHAYKAETDRTFTPPDWLKDLDKSKPRFEIFCQMAEFTFEKFGNHLAMVFMFGEKGEVLQFLGFSPADQVDKFIFWRVLSEKVIYLRAESIIYISEVWMRENSGVHTPISQAKIIGEMLHVYEVKRSGEVRCKEWNIERIENQANLVSAYIDTFGISGIPNFLVPVQSAFSKIHAR